MEDGLLGFWGMGACPHVSEAKRYPHDDGRKPRAFFAGALDAPNRPASRHGKQAVQGAER